MLLSLSIKNFAIVKSLELDFSQGMTAFTGETGAGKSIMIDALLLALGDRAHGSIIRPGQTQCDITATFIFDEQSDTAQWLKEHDIPYEDSLLFLRRIIYDEGRSKSYINGHPLPLQQLKEIGETLIHLHGQHQHQTLLKAVTHREQLDRFAGHSHLLEEVTSIYKQVQLVNQNIDRHKTMTSADDKVQLLQFQIEELSNLNLKEGEMERLHREHQLLHHAKDYLEQSEGIGGLLSSENKNNVCSLLNQILQMIAHLPQDEIEVKNTLELVNDALIHCEEARDEIRAFSETIQLDPGRLQEIEARMSAVHSLARKYHIESFQLPIFAKTLQEELDRLLHSKQQLSSLECQLHSHLAAYQSAALKLRASREQHAKQLAHEITAYLQQLGMPKGYVDIEMTPLEAIAVHGLDKIEYKVCTNPGMLPDFLSKIASGGELSRISLAIQMITAKKGRTPTLIFDEVDVGIGGSTAALVGKMLRHLGKRLQVFCVTHQAQVAASAHHHFQVEKGTDDKETTTKMTLLNSNNKINEIARMLGGFNISSQSLSHADELIKEGSSS